MKFPSYASPTSFHLFLSLKLSFTHMFRRVPSNLLCLPHPPILGTKNSSGGVLQFFSPQYAPALFPYSVSSSTESQHPSRTLVADLDPPCITCSLYPVPIHSPPASQNGFFLSLCRIPRDPSPCFFPLDIRAKVLFGFAYFFDYPPLYSPLFLGQRTGSTPNCVKLPTFSLSSILTSASRSVTEFRFRHGLYPGLLSFVHPIHTATFSAGSLRVFPSLRFFHNMFFLLNTLGS